MCVYVFAHEVVHTCAVRYAFIEKYLILYTVAQCQSYPVIPKFEFVSQRARACVCVCVCVCVCLQLFLLTQPIGGSLYECHHALSMALCPLHISRSDAPIRLRCSRRQFGTKPSDVASAHHSHWPNGAQCVHSRRLVRGSRAILYNSLVGTVKESYLLQLSVALYTFGSRSAGGVGQY